MPISFFLFWALWQKLPSYQICYCTTLSQETGYRFYKSFVLWGSEEKSPGHLLRSQFGCLKPTFAGTWQSKDGWHLKKLFRRGKEIKAITSSRLTSTSRKTQIFAFDLPSWWLSHWDNLKEDFRANCIEKATLCAVQTSMHHASVSYLYSKKEVSLPAVNFMRSPSKTACTSYFCLAWRKNLFLSLDCEKMVTHHQ